MKNYMRPKPQAALRKLFSLPSIHSSPDKILLRLWNKNILADIQKHTDICFQSASRMQFLGVQKWCSANVFSDTKQEKHVCWKICKVRKVFGCVEEAYYFQCQVS